MMGCTKNEFFKTGMNFEKNVTKQTRVKWCPHKLLHPEPFSLKFGMEIYWYIFYIKH